MHPSQLPRCILEVTLFTSCLPFLTCFARLEIRSTKVIESFHYLVYAFQQFAKKVAFLFYKLEILPK